MIQIKDPKDCCGCTACASICAHDAIKMRPDALGFLYPEVDSTKCVDCGLCDKVCAFNENYDRSLNLPQPEAYGARHKDMKEVETSRSGAAFIAISDWILAHGGVVYGAGYTDHFRVVHKRATNKEERDEFKGSKYVQSDLTGVFRQVKQDLKDGLIVLFSGTPCQTAGLNSYIGKKLRENLYLVDIVCHGVPGPNIWNDYLYYQETKFKDNVVKVDFRDKRTGWDTHIETLFFSNGKEYNGSIFTNLFYKHIMLRYSCENCKFCNTVRPADITLADFWGWENANIVMNNDNKGVSLILLNTQKGIDTFKHIQKELEIVSVTKEQYIQPNLQFPSKMHPKRIVFEADYKNRGFTYIITHKYSSENISRRIIRFFKRKLGLII